MKFPQPYHHKIGDRMYSTFHALGYVVVFKIGKDDKAKKVYNRILEVIKRDCNDEAKAETIFFLIDNAVRVLRATGDNSSKWRQLIKMETTIYWTKGIHNILNSNTVIPGGMDDNLLPTLKRHIMKPEELRIGNWYKSVKFNTPVYCELSDLNEIYHYCEGALPDEEVLSRIFNPIPLTEEWLEKFGFEKEKGFKSFHISIASSEKQRKDIVIADDYIWLREGHSNEHHSKDDICCLRDNDIQGKPYVHQLQNLYFALTGEELKMTE